MTDAFASLVGPVFQHVIDLQARLESGGIAPLGARAGADPRRARGGGPEGERLDAAGPRLRAGRYALVYWIDEMLINSPWAHAPGVAAAYPGMGDTTRSGIAPSSSTRRPPRPRPWPRPTRSRRIILCVALGFRGKHRDSPTELRRWGERVYNRIVSGGTQTDKFLPDEAVERQPLKPLPGKSILLAVSVLVSITALFTLACFVFAVPPWD